MVEDRWYSVAVPILGYVHENGGQFKLVHVGQIAAATGIEPTEVAAELDSLIAARYLVGPLKKLMTGGDPGPWFLENSSDALRCEPRRGRRRTSEVRRPRRGPSWPSARD